MSLSAILSYALDAIAASGYWGVFLVTLIENAIPPIPSEVILPFAGYLIYQGKLAFMPIILAATFANLIGAIAFYYIGKYGGRWFLGRYRKLILLKSQDIETGNKWFEKHGRSAVLFGRMIPIVRSVISIPAGVANMPMTQFIIYSFIGSLIWNVLLVSLGYFAGEHWPKVGEYFKEIEFVVEIAIVALIIWYIVKKIRSRHE